MQNCVVLSGVFFFQLAGISNYHIYNIDNTDNIDNIDNTDNTNNIDEIDNINTTTTEPPLNTSGAASAAPS